MKNFKTKTLVTAIMFTCTLSAGTCLAKRNTTGSDDTKAPFSMTYNAGGGSSRNNSGSSSRSRSRSGSESGSESGSGSFGAKGGGNGDNGNSGGGNSGGGNSGGGDSGDGEVSEPLSLIYGIDDDSDRIFFYDLTNDVDGIVPITNASKMPNEMENLTWWEGNAYYAFQSYGRSGSGRKSILYRITIDYDYDEDTDEDVFSASYVKKFTLEGIDDIDSVELIDGYFYFTDNRTNIFYKMDGELNTLEQKNVGKDSQGNKLVGKIEGLAYDADTQILYATNIRDGWRSKDNRSQLFGIYLGNGFNDMEFNFLGNLPYYKVEGLVFNNGILYGAGTSKIKQPDGSYGMLFEIDFDANGKVIPVTSGTTIPKNYSEGNIAPSNKDLYLLQTTNRPVNNWKADVEGIANVFCEQNDKGRCDTDHKVPLCHVPPGNTGNVRLIWPDKHAAYGPHSPGGHGGDYHVVAGTTVTLANGNKVDGGTCKDYTDGGGDPDPTDDPVATNENENAFGRLGVIEIQ